MKILGINVTNKRGSTGRLFYELGKYFETHGDEFFIASYSSDFSDSNEIKIGFGLDHLIHTFLSRLTGLLGYNSKISTIVFLRKVSKIRPNLIVIGNIHSNFINFPILFKYISSHKIPVVIMLHDCFPFTGKCVHFESQRCNKWKSGCGSCPLNKIDFPSLIFDMTHKMLLDKKKWYHGNECIGVVGVSKWITSKARDGVFPNNAIFETIYNYVDADIFNIRDGNYFKIKNKKIILGVSTFWDDRKGLFKFIELSELLPEKYIIVLVGKIPEKHKNRSIVNIDAISDPEEMSYIYSSANVLLQLSEQESFGLVVAESLACGTPVITNRKTANPELIDEKTGIVIETFDFDSLFGAITEICEKDKSFWQANCRKRALEKFSSKDRLADYYNFFHKLSQG